MDIEQLKKIINEMPEEEAKSLLFHVFLRVSLMKDTTYSNNEFVNDMENLYDKVLELHNKEMKEDVERVHLLFGDSAAGSLRVALKDLGRYKMEKIISFWDMFSVGPIYQLHDEAGKEARFTWMKKNMNDEYEEFQNRFQESVNEISMIQEEIPITIWVSDSSHEQTGLLYALYLLKNKENDIVVINTTKKHAELFDQKDIEYTVLHTGELSPEKIQIIDERSKNISPLTEQERVTLENEWLTLSKCAETLRIWGNGRIKRVPEDYYDSFMIQRAKSLHRQSELSGFMKSARLIGDVLGHLEQHVGDAFLEYRLRMLIDAGIFESKGSLEAMRFYSVKLKQ
ncbi:DUF1835 domain-containing protein [Bacillus sp. FJAT-50079]|nr:DUF1835 domain-containing protein [Bacillus sp. FJAT-50079]